MENLIALLNIDFQKQRFFHFVQRHFY